MAVEDSRLNVLRVPAPVRCRTDDYRVVLWIGMHDYQDDEVVLLQRSAARVLYPLPSAPYLREQGEGEG